MTEDRDGLLTRCDELEAAWASQAAASSASGNWQNTLDGGVRAVGVIFAGGSACISTLVATDQIGKTGGAIVAAVLAVFGGVATGVRNPDMFRNRALHHFEREDSYKNSLEKVRNLRSAVADGAVGVEEGYRRLDVLVEEAGRRPEIS